MAQARRGAIVGRMEHAHEVAYIPLIKYCSKCGQKLWGISLAELAMFAFGAVAGAAVTYAWVSARLGPLAHLFL